MDVPPSNERLKEAALSGYLFYGQTAITLKDGVMDVTTRTSNNATAAHVHGHGAAVERRHLRREGRRARVRRSTRRSSIDYDQRHRLRDPHACSGTYAKSLTLGSRDDILIDGNLSSVDGATRCSA